MLSSVNINLLVFKVIETRLIICITDVCVCVCVSKDILAPLRITVEVKHDHSDEKRNTSASILETSSQPVTRKIYTVDCKLYDSFYPYNHVLNYKIFSYVFFFDHAFNFFSY